MAFNRGYRKSNNNAVIMSTLSGMVTLAISLWVFDKILTVVIPLVNTSEFFGDAISFLKDLLPVIGIIAAYIMIRGALKRMSI